MFDKINHLTVLLYLLCLHFLSDWGFSQVAVTGADIKTVCIHNATASSPIGIHCGISNGRERKIEVVSTYFDHRLTPRGCIGSAAKNQCRKLLTTGENFLKTTARNRCSFLQRCKIPLGELPTTDCTKTTPFNFVLLKYKCIPYTDFVELCGNADVNITSDVKHLAYIDDDSFQNCTCSIQGPHTLTAVNVPGIPSWAQRNCKKQNVWINRTQIDKSVSTTTVLKPEQQLINVDFKELQSSHIQLIRNCRPTSQPDWFKITPAKGKTVRIQCGRSINKSPSRSSSQLSSPSTTFTTDTTIKDTAKKAEVTKLNTKSSVTSTTRLTDTTDFAQSTEIMQTRGTIKKVSAETSLKEDEKNTLSGKHTKVPVIVGSAIGGIVFIIIIIVVGALVYRRKQKSSDSKNSTKPSTNEGNEYDDVDEERNPSYVNTVADSGRDQRHGNNRIDNVSEGNYASEYEIIDANSERHNHEYEYIIDDVNGSRPQIANKLMNVTDNTYENPNDIGGTQVYMNEFVDDTNHQYSTLGQNVDNTGNYEQLKL